jgi:hypothetical protein
MEAIAYEERKGGKGVERGKMGQEKWVGGRESFRKPAEAKYECNPKKSSAASSSGSCTYAHEIHASRGINGPAWEITPALV